MKSREVARQIYWLIVKEARRGKVIRKTFDEIWASLLAGDCVWITSGERVVACAILARGDQYLKIGSLVVHKDFRGNGLAREVVDHVVAQARKISDGQIICAIAGPESERVFLSLGFVEHPKTEAGEELWGGRTQQEWLTCDRKFLVLKP